MSEPMTRAITTAAELDALPVGSVVVEGGHTTPDSFLGLARVETIPGVFHRFPDGWYVVAGHGAREVPLPASVLHDPSTPATALTVAVAARQARPMSDRLTSDDLAALLAEVERLREGMSTLIGDLDTARADGVVWTYGGVQRRLRTLLARPASTDPKEA